MRHRRSQTAVPNVSVEYAAVRVDKVVMVLKAEVLEYLAHGFGHCAIEFRALDWLVRTDLLVVATDLKDIIFSML